MRYLRQSKPALFGRDAELAQLTGCLADACAGHGRLALIGGEAGIGKTTLVEWLVAETLDRGAEVSIGRCYDLETTPPFGPWIDLLRGLAALDGAFEAALDLLRNDTSATGDATPVYPRVWALLEEAAARRPLVLMFEDIHWADDASLNLLRFAGRRAREAPVLIVLTYRDVELTRGQPLYRMLPNLVRESAALRLSLRPLGAEAVRALVDARYRLAPSEARRLVDYLLRYAEGNPFFIEELLALLDVDRVLAEGPLGWTLGDLGRVAVPALLRQVVDGRLERLDDASRRLLQTAAVIGGEAPYGVWQAVSGASDEELAGAIEQALEAQVLVEVTERGALGFRHALIREALYFQNVLPRRRALHQRTAETLAGLADADPDAVAYHYQQAGDEPRAAHWLVRAGQRAARSFAFQITTDRFEQALAILQRLPGREEDRVWLLCDLAESFRLTDSNRALDYVNDALELVERMGDPALRAVVLRSRSHIRGFHGQNALAEFEEALAAYEGLSDEDRARIDRSPLGYTVRYGTLAQRIVYYGRFGRARELATRFLSDPDATAGPLDHREYGLALLGLGMACGGLGLVADARRALEEARGQFRAVGNAYMIGFTWQWEHNLVLYPFLGDQPGERRRAIEEADAAFRRSVYASMTPDEESVRVYPALILEGRWAEARKSASALLSTTSVRFECALALVELDWLQGSPVQARALIDSIFPEGPEAQPSNPQFFEALELARIGAELALDAGDLALAERWITCLERWLGWSDVVFGHPTPERLRARALLVQGDLAGARRHAERALALASHPRQPLALVEAHRIAGRIEARAGKGEAATAHLRAALALAEVCEVPWQVAASRLALAEVLLPERPDESRALLSLALEAAEALGAAPLAERAAELLAAVPARRPEADLPGGLSVRELEVLRLVAQGLTDAQIAGQLSISTRTVSGHLQSIYNKLGVSSRTAATALAWERRIV